MARDLLGGHPRLRLLTYRAMFAVAEGLPLWGARFLAYGIGLLTWLIDAKARRVVTRNLAHLVPTPEALRRCVRRSYVAFSWSIAESFAMGKIPRRRFLPPYLTVVDPWGVFAEKPRRRPTIFVTVHCNWELAIGMYHHLALIEGCAAVARSHGDEKIDQLFDRMRGRFNCRSLLLDRAPLAALRALREGKHLCLLGERDYTGNGLRVSFAGDRARIPVGAAALAVQTGADIVPCMLARRGAERFTLVLGRPLRAAADQPKGPQVQSLTQDLATTFTRFLACAPGQWEAFHPAFG